MSEGTTKRSRKAKLEPLVDADLEIEETPLVKESKKQEDIIYKPESMAKEPAQPPMRFEVQVEVESCDENCCFEDSTKDTNLPECSNDPTNTPHKKEVKKPSGQDRSSNKINLRSLLKTTYLQALRQQCNALTSTEDSTNNNKDHKKSNCNIGEKINSKSLILGNTKNKPREDDLGCYKNKGASLKSGFDTRHNLTEVLGITINKEPLIKPMYNNCGSSLLKTTYLQALTQQCNALKSTEDSTKNNKGHKKSNSNIEEKNNSKSLILGNIKNNPREHEVGCNKNKGVSLKSAFDTRHNLTEELGITINKEPFMKPMDNNCGPIELNQMFVNNSSGEFDFSGEINKTRDKRKVIHSILREGSSKEVEQEKTILSPSPPWSKAKNVYFSKYVEMAIKYAIDLSYVGEEINLCYFCELCNKSFTADLPGVSPTLASKVEFESHLNYAHINDKIIVKVLSDADKKSTITACNARPHADCLYDTLMWAVYKFMELSNSYLQTMGKCLQNFRKTWKILSYKCYVCRVCYEWLGQYMEHLMTDHGVNDDKPSIDISIEPVGSGLINLIAYNKKSLFYHSQDLPVTSLENQDPSFRCIACKATFENDKDAYRKHQTAKIKCVGCEKKYYCHEIHKHIGRCNNYLQNPKVFPKTCPCKNVFYNIGDLVEHQLDCVFGQSVLTFTCLVCGHVSATTQLLKEHQELSHAVRSDQFIFVADKIRRRKPILQMDLITKSTTQRKPNALETKQIEEKSTISCESTLQSDSLNLEPVKYYSNRNFVPVKYLSNHHFVRPKNPPQYENMNDGRPEGHPVELKSNGSSQQSLSCPVCCVLTDSGEALDQHLLDIHSVKQGNLVPVQMKMCWLCLTWFMPLKSSENLLCSNCVIDRERVVYHGSGIQVYECLNCKFKEDSMTAIRSHCNSCYSLKEQGCGKYLAQKVIVPSTSVSTDAKCDHTYANKETIQQNKREQKQKTAKRRILKVKKITKKKLQKGVPATLTLTCGDMNTERVDEDHEDKDKNLRHVEKRKRSTGSDQAIATHSSLGEVSGRKRIKQEKKMFKDVEDPTETLYDDATNLVNSNHSDQILCEEHLKCGIIKKESSDTNSNKSLVKDQCREFIPVEVKQERIDDIDIDENPLYVIGSDEDLDHLERNSPKKSFPKIEDYTLEEFLHIKQENDKELQHTEESIKEDLVEVQRKKEIKIKIEPMDVDKESIAIRNDNVKAEVSIEDFIENTSEISMSEMEPEVLLSIANSPKQREQYKCPGCSFRGSYKLFTQHVATCDKLQMGKDTTWGKRFITTNNLLELCQNFDCSWCHGTYPLLSDYYAHRCRRGKPCPKCNDPITKTNFKNHFRFHIRESYVPAFSLNDRTGNEFTMAYRCIHCKHCVENSAIFNHWERHQFFKQETMLVKADPDSYDAHFHSLPENESSLSHELLQTLLRALQGQERFQGKKRVCDVCAKPAERRYVFKIHLIEHLIEDAYSKATRYGALRCQICPSDHMKADSYKQHMREHARLPLYQCHICDKTFSDSSNFAKHKKVHNLQVKICDICQRKFQCKAMLAKHLKMHDTAAPLTCHLCPASFLYVSQFKKHMKYRHGSGRLSYSCSFCKSRHNTMKDKWDHEWQMHGERKRDADCPLCGERFRKVSDVRTHMRWQHSTRMLQDSSEPAEGSESAGPSEPVQQAEPIDERYRRLLAAMDKYDISPEAIVQATGGT